MRIWSATASSKRCPAKGSFVAGRNIELIREEQLRLAEGHLQKAVDLARSSGITLGELSEILTLLYREE